MVLWTSKGRIRRWNLAEEKFWTGLKGWLYVQAGLWKWKSTYHYVENSAHFELKIELLLTVLYNFEREVALKDSAFWQIAFLNNKLKWFVYNLITNLTGLAWHVAWYIK